MPPSFRSYSPIIGGGGDGELGGLLGFLYSFLRRGWTTLRHGAASAGTRLGEVLLSAYITFKETKMNIRPLLGIALLLAHPSMTAFSISAPTIARTMAI